MSDDELVRRVRDIDARIGFVTRFGGSIEALQQMQAIRTLIEAERRERVFHEVWAGRDHRAVVVETDPDLKQAEEPAVEEEVVHVPRPKPVRRLAPSPVPIPTRTPAPKKDA